MNKFNLLMVLSSLLFLNIACSDYIANKREGLKRMNLEERQEEDTRRDSKKDETNNKEP